MLDKKAKEILNAEAEKMTGFKFTGDGYVLNDKQVSAITAIRHKLNYSRSHLFNFILNCFPDEHLRNRLTDSEKKHYKLSAIYQLLNKQQKSFVIKRLDLMKKNYASGKK